MCGKCVKVKGAAGTHIVKIVGKCIRFRTSLKRMGTLRPPMRQGKESFFCPCGVVADGASHELGGKCTSSD